MKRNVVINFAFIILFLSACSKGGSDNTPQKPADTTPVISSVSLSEGYYNDDIYIKGSNFATSRENTKVLFNNTPAVVNSVTASMIYVNVPLGAETGNIKITINGVTVTGPVFTYKKTLVVSPFAGQNGTAGKINGVGTAATFYQPYGLAFDKDDNLYVADAGNNMIRKIATDGTVSTFAGTGLQGDINGDAASASFNGPSGVTIDNTGNVYIADTHNSRIRKITPQGQVTTLAGDGLSHSNNGTGAGASFSDCQGITCDNNGYIYVADTQNSLIRKVSSSAVVTTLAGSGIIDYKDGAGTAASFGQPMGIVADKSGNMYIADARYHIVRKITPDGVVTTYADGGADNLKYAQGIAIDNAGNLYVSDFSNRVIYKIGVDKNVVAFAGSKDVLQAMNGLALKAGFMGPRGIAVNSKGDIYVADAGSNQILKVAFE